MACSRNPDGVSALLWSVYCGRPALRESLFASRAAQSVPLDVFEAAAIGDVASLQSILAADPAAAFEFSPDGWTALHLAAGFGTPGAVAALLSAGAEVNALSRNPQKNQPLHAAVALGKNPDTVNLLLANGAQANALQAGGFTALFSAAAANCRDLAETLVAHGADPARKSDAGKTAADFARERGHLQMAVWLESL